MKVIVDGLIYQRQARGGISRVYTEILPRMCSLDPTLRIKILTSGPLHQPLPEHPSIVHRRLLPLESLLRPGRFWRPFTAHMRSKLLTWEIEREGGGIWHSTYYTRPKGRAGREVVTVHDMIHERYPELFNRSSHDRFRERKRDCVLNADAVICVSATTERDLHRFYDIDPTKTWVIHSACSHVFQRITGDLRRGLPTRRPFLLYVGARLRHKNFAVLLQAYGMWAQRKDVELVVVGRPWAGWEERMLVQLSIADRVRLLTGVSDHRLAELYNQAVAFVYPSLYEGFGIPLLEAMACGCLVIASDIPSTREVAGDAPIYFDPKQAESLRAALTTACREQDCSRKVGLGLRRVKAYSWDRTARQTLEVYRAVSKTK